MTDKKEMLKLLREEKARWEDLLGRLSEAEIVAPDLAGGWSIKDVMAHLAAWQQLTLARLQAARERRAPVSPRWSEGLDPDADENLEPINTWIFETYHARDWASVQREWQEGFQYILDISETIPESELLEAGRYAWLESRALMDVLHGAYAHHHEEHFEPLTAWLREHGKPQGGGEHSFQ